MDTNVRWGDGPWLLGEGKLDADRGSHQPAKRHPA